MDAATPATGPSTPMLKLSGLSLVFVASVSSALLASALSLAGQYLSARWQEQRTTRISEVTKFIDTAQQFDGLVTKFMSPFLKGGRTEIERRALQENIQAQFELLETARSHLDDKQSARAKDYQDSLVVVDSNLSREVKAPDAQELVQAISNTRAKNVCVVFDLREKAGLPVIKSDANDCAA